MMLSNPTHFLIAASVSCVAAMIPEGQIPFIAQAGKLPDGWVQPYTYANHEITAEKNICNPPELFIIKEQTSRKDTSAMLAFKYPAGGYCWLEFLAPRSSKNYQVQVHTQREVAKCPSTSNYHNNHIGTLDVPAAGGLATWRETFQDHLTKPWYSKCPDAGSTEGYDLVGVGQDVDLKWKQSEGYGLRIAYRK